MCMAVFFLYDRSAGSKERMLDMESVISGVTCSVCSPSQSVATSLYSQTARLRLTLFSEHGAPMGENRNLKERDNL